MTNEESPMTELELTCSASTLRMADLPTRAAAAAAAGFVGLGLRTTDILGSGLTDEEIGDLLDRYGLRVLELEHLWDWAQGPDPAEEAIFRFADRVGIRQLNVPMFAEHPLDDLVEPFGALCDRAADHGVLVGFEFLPYSGVRTIGEVWQVVSGADRPNGGIILDLWHWFRSGASVADLADIPASAFTSVQLCDVAAVPGPEMAEESRHGRLLPGAGAGDTFGLLLALRERGIGVPVSVEVFSDVLDAQPAAESARQAYDAGASVLRKAALAAPSWTTRPHADGAMTVLAPSATTKGFTEEDSARVVIESLRNTPDERLKEVLTSLVEHLHAFVKDIEPSHAEWQAGIDYLTAVGHMCDETRQEFVLFSDVLGVSMLVDAVNNRRSAAATDTTVLGPFHMVESPPRELGATISLDGNGEPCVFAGQVRSSEGTPLPGALVDVWQANGAGYYDVQQPDVQPERNLRGLFTTDERGLFWLQTVVPRYYPIPDDGPVGRLLAATRRHPNRPAHIHLIAEAAGHASLTTHVFVEGSPYLDSDTVFGVKEALIRPATVIDDPDRAEHYGVGNPFRLIEFDVVLDRVGVTAG